MRGGGSGIFFLASWRIGFSIFVWIGSVLFLFLLWQCLKSFLQAVKDQGWVFLILFRSKTSAMLLLRAALFCEAEPVQATGRRGREREADVFTVNCPPTNPYCPAEQSARQVSSLTNLESTLPNTPTPSVEPPPYNSVLHNTPEDPPPAYDSLYTQKDNRRTDNLPPV